MFLLRAAGFDASGLRFGQRVEVVFTSRDCAVAGCPVCLILPRDSVLAALRMESSWSAAVRHQSGKPRLIVEQAERFPW